MAELKGVRFPSLAGFLDLQTLPGVWATIMFRVADRAHRLGLRPISRLRAFANFDGAKARVLKRRSAS